MESFVPSVLLRPIDPSLKDAHKKTFGYAVNSEPSEFKGIVPNVFVILYVGRPFVFKRISSLLRVSLALLISMYLVSLLTISNPLIYAFPGPTLATSFSCASETEKPFTRPNTSVEYTPRLPFC